MLGKRIYLYQEKETVYFEGRIPFAVTHTFWDNCFKYHLNGDRLLNDFAHNQVFLIIQRLDKQGQKRYAFLTENIIFNSIITPEGYFRLTNLIPKNVRIVNDFINRSIKIYAREGAVIWYTNKNKRPFIYPNSLINANREIFIRNFQGVLNPLLNKLSEIASTSGLPNDNIVTPESLSDELDELLDIAENYTIAEDEDQKVKAQAEPHMLYEKYKSATDYTRVDKVAYDFYIRDFDSQVFKNNTRVAITLINEQAVIGTITGINSDNEFTVITIRFDEVFDVQLLPPSGLISVEYDDVQRQVRQAVINDLREFNSRAQYFNDVIGLNKFAGFEKKDLNKLISAFNNSERPPNKSQSSTIIKGITTKDVLLVLGPPGTGKTTVILEWVKYFVKEEGKKVLVSSQNNKAVDNVLEKLIQEPGIDTIRVGKEDRIQDNIRPFMFESRALELQKKIIEATNYYNALFAKAKRTIDDYYLTVKSTRKAYIEFDSINQALINRYSELEYRYVNEMHKLYDDFASLSRELDKLKREINKNVSTIHKHNQLNNVLQLLVTPVSKYINYSLAQKHNKYAQLINKEKQIVETYNLTYLQLLNELSSEDTGKLKEEWEICKSNWEKSLHQARDIPVIEPINSVLMNISPSISGIATDFHFMEEMVHQCEVRLGTIKLVDNAISRWRTYLEHRRNYALAQILLESVDLVGATCIGINTQPRFKDISFDVTIIDEAGQIQIHNAIVPMSRSPKLIMLGDHLQIPPIAEDSIIKRCEEGGIETSLLTTSFFEYLYNKFPDENKVLLDTQYRMPAEIATLLSQWFYENRYESSDNKYNLQSPIAPLFNSPFVVISTSKSQRRFETKVPNEGYCNYYEAFLAVEILKVILNAPNPEFNNTKHETKNFTIEDIGIISPYNQQVKYIRDHINKQLGCLTREQIDNSIASLDSFQGQERAVIIYSCTRSNRISFHKKRIGFLNELRRLNVALSRCQIQLIFIGDIDFFTACKFEEKDHEGKPKPGASEMEFAQFIQFMLKHIENGDGQLLDSIKLEKTFQKQ